MVRNVRWRWVIGATTTHRRTSEDARVPRKIVLLGRMFGRGLHLGQEAAQASRLLRVGVDLFRIGFGGLEADVPDQGAHEREAEDDEEEGYDGAAVCLDGSEGGRRKDRCEEVEAHSGVGGWRRWIRTMCAMTAGCHT